MVCPEVYAILVGPIRVSADVAAYRLNDPPESADAYPGNAKNPSAIITQSMSDIVLFLISVVMPTSGSVQLILIYSIDEPEFQFPPNAPGLTGRIKYFGSILIHLFSFIVTYVLPAEKRQLIYMGGLRIFIEH